MSPAELASARKTLGLSVTGLAEALRLGENGSTAIREMERGKRPISGPVQVALELMLDNARMVRIKPLYFYR